MEFQEFPKLARLHREIIITEKIDGTNAAIVIEKCRPIGGDAPSEDVPVSFPKVAFSGIDYNGEVYAVGAQSRKRLVTPVDDNFGFARWVSDHAQELVEGLGEGRHFGEWWGSGIQRGYGLTNGDKRFSLFNTARWEDADLPAGVTTVPVLSRYETFAMDDIESDVLELRYAGSSAAPGFMDPEGIVVFHTASNQAFKYTLGNDGHKGEKG